MAIEFYLLSFIFFLPPPNFPSLSSSIPWLDLFPVLSSSSLPVYPLLPSFHIVPSPTIIIGLVGESYNGTTYSVTCTITLDSSVDTDLSISSQWSYTGDMTSYDTITTTTEQQGLLQQTNLTFRPLRTQDAKRYTCTVDIEQANPTAYVLRNNVSGDIFIIVKSELQSVPMLSVFSCVTNLFLRTACS